jgi:hypothetical protein
LRRFEGGVVLADLTDQEIRTQPTRPHSVIASRDYGSYVAVTILLLYKGTTPLAFLAKVNEFHHSSNRDTRLESTQLSYAKRVNMGKMRAARYYGKEGLYLARSP